jgi:hypothetical protein
VARCLGAGAHYRAAFSGRADGSGFAHRVCCIRTAGNTPSRRFVNKARSFEASATGNKCVVALGKEDVPTMEVMSKWLR